MDQLFIWTREAHESKWDSCPLFKFRSNFAQASYREHTFHVDFL